MPTPLRVDARNEQDGEATITRFTCQCGHAVIGPDDPNHTVFAGLDTLVCRACDREWSAAWHGMRFCTRDGPAPPPSPAPSRQVKSDYFAEDVTDE